jgi:uncharacterized protein (TIGR03435 family)
MTRIPLAALAAAIAFSAAARAQTPAACDSLTFEVASIKPHPLTRTPGRFGLTPGGERYEAIGISPMVLLAEAFQIHSDQIIGLPDWMHRESYDVIAKPERPSRPPEMHCMLRNLFAQRFHFRYHRETRSLPADVLTVDAGGPKLRESDPGADFSFDQPHGAFAHQIKMNGHSVSMDYFAWRVSRVMNLPASDQTGLTGRYEIDLTFVEEVDPGILERRLANGHGIDTHPTIFEALRQQLGLRLEAKKGPVEVIVVDRADRPGEN